MGFRFELTAGWDPVLATAILKYFSRVCNDNRWVPIPTIRIYSTDQVTDQIGVLEARSALRTDLHPSRSAPTVMMVRGPTRRGYTMLSELHGRPI